jgi:hypothetical protein
MDKYNTQVENRKRPKQTKQQRDQIKSRVTKMNKWVIPQKIQIKKKKSI